MRVPQMEKIFLRMLGMSELKNISYKGILRKDFLLMLHVKLPVCMLHGCLIALTNNFFNSEKCCFFESTSEQFCLENM